MAKVVAVIGASNNRSKFGNRAVRAFRRQGYTVVPINPHETEVEGLKAYASVLDVPGPIDMASFYVPPDVGEQVIEEVARKQIPEVWLNPAPRATRSSPAPAACPSNLSSPAASSPSGRIPTPFSQPTIIRPERHAYSPEAPARWAPRKRILNV